MGSLYALTEELRPLLAAVEEVDEETGECIEVPEIRAQLDALEMDYTKKLDAYARVVRGLERDAEVCDAEAKRLADRSKRLLAQAARIEAAMLGSMVATETKKVKGPLFTISVRDGSARVEVDEPAALPAEYLRIVPEKREPDKRAIKAAFDKAVNVPGARLVPGEPSLTIK